MVLIQPLFFLLRRLMIAIAIVVVNQVLIWQIFLMASQIVASVIIIGNLRPYKYKDKRHIEIFNEIVLMFVMYTIMCFSDWVPDASMRFNVGYLCIICISLHLVVNLAIIGRSTYHRLKMILMLKFALRKYKKARLLKKEKQAQNRKKVNRGLKSKKKCVGSSVSS